MKKVLAISIMMTLSIVPHVIAEQMNFWKVDLTRYAGTNDVTSIDYISHGSCDEEICSINPSENCYEMLLSPDALFSEQFKNLVDLKSTLMIAYSEENGSCMIEGYKNEK